MSKKSDNIEKNEFSADLSAFTSHVSERGAASDCHVASCAKSRSTLFVAVLVAILMFTSCTDLFSINNDDDVTLASESEAGAVVNANFITPPEFPAAAVLTSLPGTDSDQTTEKPQISFTADFVQTGQGGFESTNASLVIKAPPETAAAEADEVTYTVYRVKQGDMIGLLAESFGITQDTLISVNNIKQSRLLQIGQYLRIPNMPGIIYSVKKDGETVQSIADFYKVSAERCATVNSLQTDSVLTAGTSIFVPNAEMDWVTRQEINGDLFIKPLRGKFYFSSYFGWRDSPFTGERSYHNGIDMATASGTNIYAALYGKVTTAGWSDIYGNHVIVTHHSGYKTLYGHMSSISVKVGQVVTTNTVLGKVGSTGKSTGPHLHFTVYKNNIAVNPANLWK